ncbi:MAG: D-alanine--D-alanine ligase [Candidatus Parcubacteria bacterium]|jgi:D-alanine-D-alanine ligase
MTKTRVAVLRGGPSSEYDVSMQTGAGVLRALADLGYHVTDITVSKTGEWIVDGRVKDPDKALLTTDVVFIAMHGAYGEDGTVQRICERLHIPFTGSNSFASAMAFNKDMTKRALREHIFHLPRHVRVTNDNLLDIEAVSRVIADSFGPTYVLKPTQSGSSHGVQIVAADTLKDALYAAVSQYGECMVEEHIQGTEATCAVLSDFRDNDLYSLPAIEIIPPQGRAFFDETVKYDGSTTELCPGRFSYEEKEKIAELARLVHRVLGLSQYSRTDCIIKDGEVYFLEVNTLPGLTSESLFPKAAVAVGLSFNELIDHLVKTARVYS